MKTLLPSTKTLVCFRTPDVGNSIVHIAVRHRQLEVVGKAVSLCPDLLREKNNNESTPLHEAAAFGNKETVQLLISLLQNSSSSTTTALPYLLEVNHDGDTPFHVALRSGNMTAAEALLEYVKHHPEILVMKPNLRKETPLHLYVRYCTEQHFPSKIKNKGNVHPNQELIQQLIQANVLGIFEPDSEGLNPLMRAAQYGRVLLIYWMLILYPLSMEWRDSKGRGFLHHLRLKIAENTGDKDYTLNICKKILEYPGVDNLTSSRDQDGNTPLHLAILDSDFDLAQLILERYVGEQSKTEKELVVSIKNTVGKTVYDLIISGPGIPRILKNLMEQACREGEMYSEQQYAVIDLDVDAATRCINEDDVSGDYSNTQDEQGKNILHMAIIKFLKPFSDQPIDSKYGPFVEKAIERWPKLIFQKDCNGDTPLHTAARCSSDAATILLHKSFVKWRLDNNHHTVNLQPRPWKVKDWRGHTPLHEAARTDNLDNLSAMIIALRTRDQRYQTEAVSEVNEYGETVYHLIARYTKEPRESVFESFSIPGRFDEVNKRDEDGLTPILRAAYCGQVTLVNRFIDWYAPSLNTIDYKGQNVLHHLCTSALTKGAELKRLIEDWEASFHDMIVSQDDDGHTPLHLAITGQNVEVAEYLIRHCVQVKSLSFIKALKNTKNKEGKSIMHLITCESGGIPASLKELLEQASAAPSATMDNDLYKAAKEGDVAFVEGVYYYAFHQRSHDGRNILHIALRYQHLPIVECVLKSSVLLNFRLIYGDDSKGDTPLHLAAGLPPNIALSFLKICLDICEENIWCYPAPWKVKNAKGNTYLHEVARLCNYDVIFSELLNGKDIKDVNHRGETVLHVIVKYATSKAKDFLKNMSEQMQSFVNIKDFEGFTPVLRALQYGRLGVATLLIQQCPHVVEIPDKKGGTVLHHLKALVADRVDDVTDIFPVWDEFFKHDGIDDLRIAQNEDGNTPLHLAIIDGDCKKTKFLMEKCLHSENKRELDIINNDGHSVFDLVVSKAHILDMNELQPLVSRSYIKERELMDRGMDNALYRAAIKGNVHIFESTANNLTTTNDAESIPPTPTDAYFCSQTPSGSNVVHLALCHGKANVENFINAALDKHPILSIRPDNNGDTPLHLAVKWKSGVAIVQSLIRTSNKFLQDDSNKAYHVPPWAVKNYKGSFPIHEALQSDNLEAADALLNCDTEAASHVNDLGDTPLHSFAKNGFSISDDDADKFVENLLEKNIRAAYMRDDEGLTPLLCAARSGRLQVTRATLNHGPQSAYIRDLSGRTFLHLLRFTGEDVDESLDGTFKKTGKQLFEFPEADAQRLVQDYDGNTPLHYAIINGNSIAAIVLTYKCLEDKEQREFGLVNKLGQTIPDLLALHDVPNEIIEHIQNKVPEAVYLARSSYGIRKTEMKYSANALSVVTALLATITFAAGLQVPGGFDEDDGSPNLLRKPAFAVFVVANTIAMCCSMLCLFLLLWVMGIGKIHGSLQVLDISIRLIRLSFYLTLLTFTMGVYVTTSAKSLWLGILVIGLGILTFLLTFRFILITVARCGVRAKTYIKSFIKM